MTDDLDRSDQETENSKEEMLFGFYVEDRHYIIKLREVVRSLISRKNTTAEQIFHLAKLLHALERLPRPTTGIALELSLGHDQEDGETGCLDLYMSENAFRLGSTEWIIIEPSAGGDSRCETYFEVEVGGMRELMNATAFAGWLEEFSNRMDDPTQKLEISDSEETSEIDWTAEKDDADWEKLDSDYT